MGPKCWLLTVFFVFAFIQAISSKGNIFSSLHLGTFLKMKHFSGCGIRDIDGAGTIRRVSTLGDSLAKITEVSQLNIIVL